MTLFKLNTISTILVEDDCDKNVIPLVINMLQNCQRGLINIICYEQSAATWKKVFKEFDGKSQINYLEKIPQSFSCDMKNAESLYFIDSVNQMVLDMGWHECLKTLKQLQTDSSKIILLLHKDCLSLTSRLRSHLNHMAKAIISFDDKDPYKVNIQIKKGGKIIKSAEILSYDNSTKTLKSNPIPQTPKKKEEPVSVLPSNLSTFKIETDQIQQLEKNKLLLPYMSKINEGQGKVYYEPDAVDDWDEEDPDDDLEI